MKKKNKILISIILFIMIFSTRVNTFGSSSITSPGSATSNVVITVVEPIVFSVSVPTTLALAVNGSGYVTGANGSIKNNSGKSVKITDIKMVGRNGWTVVAGNSKPTGTRKVGLVINDIASKADGSFPITTTAFPRIGTGDSLNLKWTGVVSHSGNAVVEAATVTFIIGF